MPVSSTPTIPFSHEIPLEIREKEEDKILQGKGIDFNILVT